VSSHAVRAPREEEAAAVAALFNAVSQTEYGTADTTKDEIRTWFTAPTVDRENDILVVANTGGDLLAYGDVSGHGGKAWLDIREHPSIGDGSAAKALLDALIPRARELVSDPVVLRAWVPGASTAVKTMFERQGFALVRHSFRMEVDLAAEPPEPGWPVGVTVRSFERGRDERVVYAVQNEGFADMWEYEPNPYEEWLHFMIDAEDFDPSLWFLAEDGDAVAGICLCRPYRPGDSDIGWVRVLCVRPDWRRRGIALALLRHAFRELRARGRQHGGLGVDAESTTGALELYERAGMRVARRSDIYERTLQG
jgi:mycothiol synthase